jgi:phenylacetate-coenzyme A ligase PaaK-like adenylate-forming protein
MDAWLARRCACADTGRLADAVRARQLALLRESIDYARSRSRFYRDHFRCAPLGGLSWDDFFRLPFTRPEDLGDWERFACVSQSRIARMVTLKTSGTSGPPKRLAFSARDLEATREFFRIGMRRLVHAGDRVLVLWPGAERPCGVGDLLRAALEEDGAAVAVCRPRADAGSLLRDMREHNPHVLVAAPRQLEFLPGVLDAVRALGDRPALRGVLSSAETLPPRIDDALRIRHGCLVLDHYGMTETGYGGGVECAARDGYHLREADLFIEVVAVDSGTALPDGQTGEVVVSTLGREAMPLIRYRTGDAAAVLPGPCRCGSPLRRLSRIRGRIARRGTEYSIENIGKGEYCERNGEGDDCR